LRGPTSKERKRRGGRERERKRAKKGREGKEGCPGFKSRKGGNPSLQSLLNELWTLGHIARIINSAITLRQ